MKNFKPVIGLSPNYTQAIPDALGGLKLFLSQDYTQAVLEAGGIPLVMPMGSALEAKAYVDLIDGLLLSGGDDVNPLFYGAEPSDKLMATRPERDQFEIALIKEALNQDKPIFGICRGLQILNVCLGGTLYQDIPSEAPGNLILHRQLSKEHVGTHTIDLVEGSKLKAIMGSDTIVTNSFHHQSIKELAPSLKISARSRDGIIEGVEMQEAHFLVAVQWHPECMVKTNREMLRLFTHFVAAASQKKK